MSAWERVLCLSSMNVAPEPPTGHSQMRSRKEAQVIKAGVRPSWNSYLWTCLWDSDSFYPVPLAGQWQYHRQKVAGRKEGGEGYDFLTFKDRPKVEFAERKRGELMLSLCPWTEIAKNETVGWFFQFFQRKCTLNTYWI